MVVGENTFECHARCANGFLVRRQFLIVQYLMFGDNASFLHAFHRSCSHKNKFAVGVVLEGLHPRQVAIDIMENHDISVAEAQDSREKASLISVHHGLEVVVKNHDVPFANVRGGLWGGFDGKRCDAGVPLLLLGGTDTLALSLHVAFLGFLGFGEMAGDIFDVDQKPRVIVAPRYGPEP